MLHASVRSHTDDTLDEEQFTSSCDCPNGTGECVHLTMLSVYLRQYKLGSALIVDGLPPTTAGTACKLFTHIPCRSALTKKTLVFGVDLRPSATGQSPEPAIVTVKVATGQVTLRCSHKQHCTKHHRNKIDVKGCAHIQLVAQQHSEALDELQELANEFDGTTTTLQDFEQVGGCIMMPSFSSRNGGGQPPVYVPRRSPAERPHDDPYNGSWLDMLRGKRGTVSVARLLP